MVEADTLLEQRSQVDAVTARYRERNAALTLMRQFNRLINSIQQHRGVCLAHLAGDGLFTEDMNQVQTQVNRRLLALRHTCTEFDRLVPDAEQRNVRHGWSTVCHDWEGDALLENFEYHSFLIEQLLQLMTGLARQFQKLHWQEVLPAGTEVVDNVLPLVSRQVPELVEQLARIRGLATHAAVVSECDEEHDKKLRYWLQCAEQQNRELVLQIDNMDAQLKGGWKSLQELKNYELKLAFFLNTIKRDILHGDCHKADARQLFSLGSEIIQAYVEGVDGGIHLLRDQLEKELEAWLASH
ncbi:hypothetical protein HBA55_10975 [Pseudomaricurvus alkylphenolicus]|jgi:hypothetical protein|uniref:hypothetical protein n=1 Tax=Pseudomaricurvus alkylphenolicus TaxID=1306991 RepID=UPI00141E7520|nr:hypothetical protein [Pseudomaricurvus alkylphenolicus]NIB40113.1 hypothetical protein [Pseudomaricurvus alkylphenolicus]